MSEKKRRGRNSDEGGDPTRITDPAKGLRRMKQALRQILKVPKETILKDPSKAGTRQEEA